MYIHIGEGHRCWLVSLAQRDSMYGWITLGSFNTREAALTYAAELTQLEISVASSERR